MTNFPDTRTTPASLRLTRRVYQQIESSIGSLAAESGGMLGGDRSTGTVTHFHFDGFASRSGVTYSPDTSELNRVLDQDWNPQGVHLLGFVHSHPGGPRRPSGGDLRYAADILKAVPEMEEIVLPIVLSKVDTGRFEVLPYAVSYLGSELVANERPLTIVDDESATRPSIFAQHPTFARVRDAYDLARLERSRIIAVGCGGAASFVEDLARAGVGEFVLIDPDVVAESNLATQQVYRSELGLPKVDVLAERLRDINASVATVACPMLLDELDDAAFYHLASVPLRDTSPEVVLLCGMTDSFDAQARVNRLALNFGLPSLCAQMYAEGMGSEVTFTHPETTSACHRCILRSRYQAYANGFINNVTSDGSPYQSTARVNALKQFIALVLLHHGSNHPRWNDVLTRLANRNLVQIRHRPDCPLPAFHMALDGGNANLLFCDETVWLPQTPDATPCPDCGGQGNLRPVQGTLKDTRYTCAREV
jgi:proteasome lid subunit RPN8/RPN11